MTVLKRMEINKMNTNINIKSFTVNGKPAVSSLVLNEAVDEAISINGSTYSKGESGGVSTLYCWRNTRFGIYYYTSTENPSVGDTVYSYLYFDGSGNPITSMLKNDRTVAEVGDDTITVAYTEDKATKATFSRYSTGDVGIV
jgi:hypothetical protein